MAETPALSPSIAHVLTSESPLHAWTIHRLLGNRPRPVTDAQQKGQLIHALMLEDGKGVEVVPFDDFRKKEARELRDAAREAGLIPVAEPKYDEAMRVVGRLNARLLDFGIRLTGGEPEVSLEWNEAHETGDVLCHGRVDYRIENTVYDVKTTDGGIHPDICAAKMVREAGAIQHAAYLSALRTLEPQNAGRHSVVFLFCELKDPYDVMPVEAAGTMAELGESRWQRAVDLWARCLRDDHWPGYATGITRVDAPAWALAKALEEEMAA